MHADIYVRVCFSEMQAPVQTESDRPQLVVLRTAARYRPPLLYPPPSQER